MRFVLLATIFVIAVFSCIGCSHYNAGVNNSIAIPGTSVWTASPDLTDNLAPETHVGDFAIRAPSGFTYFGSENDGGVVRFGFIGPSQEGKVHSFMSVDVHPETALATQESFTTAAQHWSLRVTNEYQPVSSSYIQSPLEIGLVNNMPAARIYLRGLIPLKTGGNGEEHVVLYRVRSNNIDAFVTATDIDPYAKTSLPTLEAACLSIRSTK